MLFHVHCAKKGTSCHFCELVARLKEVTAGTPPNLTITKSTISAPTLTATIKEMADFL